MVFLLCYVSMFEVFYCGVLTTMWGWGYGGKNMIWIKWETICKSKESGDL